MANQSSWNIDPAHSNVEFSVKHMMFTTVHGRFKSFSGCMDLDEDNPNKSLVIVEIDADSIDTGVVDRDKHLRSADFLDAQNHPKIKFRSKQVDGAIAKEGDHFKVLGELEIRGTKLDVELACTFEGQGKDPWGKRRTGFGAHGELDRRDWGLKWNQAIEAGGVLVGNKVKIDIDVQAVEIEMQQKQSA